MTFSPTSHPLALRNEAVLSLDAGDEIRCIGGRMQVRLASLTADPWSMAPASHTLLPGRVWRMPCSGIVTSTALEPGTRFTHRRQKPLRVHTQENRAYPGARRLWQSGLSALRLIGGSVR